MAIILAQHFAGAGHQVEVLTDTPDPKSEHTAPNYRVTRTTRHKERLQCIARNDVVVFMNISLVGLIPTLVLRKHIVASHHGIYFDIGIRALLLNALKRFSTRFTVNVCCSNYVAGKIPGRSVVIANAYDDLAFPLRQVKSPSRDFVFCGRLVSDKGADLLIRSFSNVVSEIPESTLSIIGDGPERSSLEQLARKLNIKKQIDFLGPLVGSRQSSALHQHFCLVVPSIWEEPFGIVALEGVACCSHVIVSRRGGLPEAVGPCGKIVDPTVESLSSEMLVCARAHRMGRASFVPTPAAREAHLARHTMRRVSMRYLRVIETTLQRRRLKQNKMIFSILNYYMTRRFKST